MTDADFASAIASTTVCPKPRCRIDSSYSNLHLPIAPPSPLFHEIDEDVETVPFPVLEDTVNTYQDEPESAPHCTLHCGHGVCMHLVRNGLDSLACHCESEESEPEDERTVTSWCRPEMDLDHLVMSSIKDSVANTDPLHEIEIRHDEVLKMLAHLQDRAHSLAPQSEYLVYAMHCDYPGNGQKAIRTAVDQIFRIMRLYFHRTLRSQDYRSITIQQLQFELNVYLWTLLAEWVEAYCDDGTCDRVLEDRGPISITKAHSGSPGAVTRIWKKCIEEVIGLLLWRDEEVRWCKVESRVVFCVLTVLITCVLIIFLWMNLDSYIQDQ